MTQRLPQELLKRRIAKRIVSFVDPDIAQALDLPRINPITRVVSDGLSYAGFRFIRFSNRNFGLFSRFVD